MTSVSTPSPLPEVSSPKAEVETLLRNEFKENGQWTAACTASIQKSPRLLLEFDRLEHQVALAFGGSPGSPRILLNPLMMICYHPKCIRKPFVTLKHICDISDYILHLASHTDELGRCMFERFKLLKKNIFVDDFASQVSPNLLLGSEGPQIDEVKTLPHMKKFTILRQLGKDSNGLRLTYVCHWKDILIKEGCITSQSLSFQEDDALAEMALAYPNPVQDWAKYRTISFYGLKLMCSTSSTAVALHRGVTKYPCFTKVDPEMLRRKEFMRNINHPSAAISTMKGWFPKVTYEREQYHGKNHKLHLRLLSKAKAGQGVVLVFPGVRRIPVSTVIDEQELNQGTFVEKGILYGLAEPLDAAKIREIGLENLANYIATKCPFQHSVREYRITDLSGSYCSSRYTQYLAGSFKTGVCTCSSIGQPIDIEM